MNETHANPFSAEVVRAEQLDAMGSHAEALVQLVAGVRKQDTEALTRLGKRLLIGDRAPCRPVEAEGLVGDAVRLGGAEAAALQATLRMIKATDIEGMRLALYDLALAAARGFPGARRQLSVLAGIMPATPDFAETDRDWRALAEGFDLAAWLEAPAAHQLHPQPRVVLIPGFIPPAFCRWIIECARGRLARAHVYDGVARATTIHQTRTNSAAMFNLLETDCVLALVQQRMCRSLDVSLRYFEPAAVLHYAVGQEIRPHFDFVDPNVPNHDDEIAQRGQRVVTFLVYLNEDYGDGQTEFPRLGLSHKGRAGEALYFLNALPDGKADLRSLHAGRPPSTGEKWIVSQFVRDRPVL